MYFIKSILDDPVIIPLGSAILTIHIVLFLIFKYVCSDGPWKALPSFTAHQVIAFVLMVYQTYLGFRYHQDSGMMNVNLPGVFMARFSIAVSAEIPTQWRIPNMILLTLRSHYQCVGYQVNDDLGHSSWCN